MILTGLVSETQPPSARNRSGPARRFTHHKNGEGRSLCNQSNIRATFPINLILMYIQLQFLYSAEAITFSPSASPSANFTEATNPPRKKSLNAWEISLCLIGGIILLSLPLILYTRRIKAQRALKSVVPTPPSSEQQTADDVIIPMSRIDSYKITPVMPHPHSFKV